MKVKCTICSCSFKNTWNLKRHATKKHPNEVSQLVQQKYKNKSNYLHSCAICGKNFNKEYNLKYHMKSHDDADDKRKSNFKCPLCDYSHFSKQRVIQHFQEDHNIEIVSETLVCDSKTDFDEWKNQLETESNCKFVKAFTKSVGDKTYTHFACHRSGNFVSKGKGMRDIKSQGSCKINAFCPANLKLLEDKEGKCNVTFISKHIGHTSDLSHSFLTTEEKQNIATKIASKVPFDSILEDIRSSVSGTDIKRIHLVTRKDLYNIETQFKLNSNSTRHINEAVSIDTWINEMKQNTDCFLYYKPKDVLDTEQSELQSEDFMLIIMNDAQCGVLKKYGTDFICIDSTHGINADFEFELTTLTVLDDTKQGFPSAFLISNRTDEEVLKIFLQYIKSHAGYLQSKIFMSDMADCFYNAWVQIMDEAKYRLFSTWDVDRDWRNNLKKIKSQTKQVSVYKQLKTILMERDEDTFKEMVENFNNILWNDIDTTEFADYFNNNYLSRCEHWAYCYRDYIDINTNMHIASMHTILKHIYCKGKTVTRLDKAVCALMKFVRGKLFDRMIVLHKGKVTSKLKDIRSRHKSSHQMDKKLIVETENGWEIPSSSKSFSEMYSLQENNVFNDCQCQLICSECGVCIHRYVCSCMDYSIKWNMCKHIHLLCQFRKEIPSPQHITIIDELDDGDTLHMEIDDTDCETEIIELSTITPSNKTTETIFNDKKKEIKQKLQHIMDIFESIETFQELNEFHKIITPIAPSWEAITANEDKGNITKTKK